MVLNPWSRRWLVLVVAIFAVGGLLIGSSSSSQDGDGDEDTSREIPEVESARTGKTLTITIAAAENGQMSSVKLGLAKLFDGPLDGGRIRQIDRRLKDVFAIEGAFGQVVLRVDKRLNSGNLIEVIHVCERQKTADGNPVKKIGFVILGED